MVGIVIVDGTGGGFLYPNDVMYDLDYGNSNCKKIDKMFPNTLYQRGPTVVGLEMGTILQGTIQNAHRFCVTPECKGLILIGHSRGGAAVIAAAQKLDQEGVAVDFMGLFDAVEMDVNFSYDVDCIPANVKAVRHGQRMPSTLSRPWWGNCGDAWGGGANFRRPYWGTHGSLGGVPPPLTAQNAGDWIWEDANALSTLVTIEKGHMASTSIWQWILAGIVETVTAVEARKPEDWERGEYGKGRSWLPPGGRPNYGGGGGGKPGGGGQKHIVQSGESLSLIAGQYWKDVLLWPIIYDANVGVIGTNPNLIQPRQPLTIPDISGYSKAKLDENRARGRNC